MESTTTDGQQRRKQPREVHPLEHKESTAWRGWTKRGQLIHSTVGAAPGLEGTLQEVRTALQDMGHRVEDVRKDICKTQAGQSKVSTSDSVRNMPTAGLRGDLTGVPRAAGEWERWVGIEGSDELDQLELAFERMANQFQTTVRQLEDAVLRARDTEARFQSMLGSLSDGIVVFDERGIVRSFNPDAERLFDRAAGEVIGRSVRAVLPAVYEVEVGGPPRELTRPGDELGAAERELVGRRRDGDSFPVDLTISEIRLDDRRWFVAVVRNRSERERADEVLLERETRFQREFERLLAAHQALSAGLEQARLEGVLLAARTAQHELNNKLSLTTGYAEILSQDPSLPPHLREAARAVLEGANAAANVLSQLQRVTRLERKAWGPEVLPTLDLRRSVD
jgi:PAS domain S-box-containing protein